jgi:hypothetical protein
VFRLLLLANRLDLGVKLAVGDARVAAVTFLAHLTSGCLSIQTDSMNLWENSRDTAWAVGEIVGGLAVWALIAYAIWLLAF